MTRVGGEILTSWQKPLLRMTERGGKNTPLIYHKWSPFPPRGRHEKEMTESKMKMKNCVFAGSFDPLTNGHVAVIHKCLNVYDKVFIVLGKNPNKKPMFSEEERAKMLFKVYGNNPKIKIVSFGDYENDYGKFLSDNNVEDYVRGIRDEKDLEFEKGYEEKNKKLYPFVKTVYIYIDGKNAKISSSMVREMINRGEDFSGFVPKEVEEIIKGKNSK